MLQTIRPVDGPGRRILTSPSTNADTSYVYDGLSRLKKLTLNMDGTAHDTVSDFTYTAASEIKSVTRSNDVYAFTELYNVSDRTYTTNPLNQYTAINTNSTARTLAYDGNGNLVQIKLTGTGEANGWGYDPENRLTSETTTAAGSTVATPSAALTYDPLGRLYATTDQTPATDVTTRFAYYGGQIIAEYDTNVQLARRYVHVSSSPTAPGGTQKKRAAEATLPSLL